MSARAKTLHSTRVGQISSKDQNHYRKGYGVCHHPECWRSPDPYPDSHFLWEMTSVVCWGHTSNRAVASQATDDGSIPFTRSNLIVIPPTDRPSFAATKRSKLCSVNPTYQHSSVEKERLEPASINQAIPSPEPPTHVFLTIAASALHASMCP